MAWSKKDRLLFHLINEAGKRYFKRQVHLATATFMKAKVKPNLVFFGTYNLSTRTFHWLNQMNEITLDYIRKGYMSVFGSDETIVKLCQPSVPLDLKDRNVIPYLIDIVNAAYSVVRFEKGKERIFAMTKLDLPDTFDFEQFNNSMFIYRTFHVYERKTRRNIRNIRR